MSGYIHVLCIDIIKLQTSQHPSFKHHHHHVHDANDGDTSCKSPVRGYHEVMVTANVANKR